MKGDVFGDDERAVCVIYGDEDDDIGPPDLVVGGHGDEDEGVRVRRLTGYSA